MSALGKFVFDSLCSEKVPKDVLHAYSMVAHSILGDASLKFADSGWESRHEGSGANNLSIYPLLPVQ